jgi:hypothetical protein
MKQEQTTSPVDERDEAFQALRELIVDAPIDAEYRIKLLNALGIYIKTLT